MGRSWPWVAQQEWKDMLFLHWPVSVEELRPHIPEPFILETYCGKAWLTIILFEAKQSRPRGMPSCLSYPSFLQANVRTYVTCNQKPGIYFFSIDANRSLIVNGAKYLLNLPYEKATMHITKNKHKILYRSQGHDQNQAPVYINVSYEPTEDPIDSNQGTLAYWLTERYFLWFMKNDKIIQGSISHQPWKLYHTDVEINQLELPEFLQQPFTKENPLAYYAKSKHAYLHPFKQEGIYLK